MTELIAADGPLHEDWAIHVGMDRTARNILARALSKVICGDYLTGPQLRALSDLHDELQVWERLDSNA